MGVFIAGCVQATEFRSPYLSERGPLRYKFEKGNADRYSLDLFSSMYQRESHKAFLSHSTKAKPLTALMFNKSDFTLKEIFPNNTIPLTAVNQNPFLSYTTIRPRATYYDWGFNFGGRFEYPVYKDKGRIGLRANLPFRLIEMEREDITDSQDDQIDEAILRRMTTVETGNASGATVNRVVKAVNFYLLKNLYQDPAHNSALSSANDNFRIFGTNVAQDLLLSAVAPDNRTLNEVGPPQVGVVYNEAGKDFPAEPSAAQKWAFNKGDNSSRLVVQNRLEHAVQASGAAPGGIANDIDGTGGIATLVNGIAFLSQKTPTGADGNAYNYNVDNFTEAQLRDMWLVYGYNNGALAGDSQTIDNAITQALSLYPDDVYEWLRKYGNGFEFETHRRTGLGDLDLDLFYEHTFSSRWIAELMLGVRFPTGFGDDYYGNPYKTQTGNGQHWEIKFGGMVAWEPLGWMNAKLDIYGAYAFESTEQRCAAFTGANIKNIGPQVGADVDWWYFVGRLDFNFFHPKTKDISGLIGYEFYYKGEDNLHFKRSQMTPWYGDNVPGTAVISNAANLSNGLAERHTEAIGHKVRLEGRIQINKWFEGFGGLSYTFAGQNLPRETDLHGGCNVRF